MAILLPFAKQQFADANGTALSLGTVTLYVPGTTTPKDSWQDSGQSMLNTNPIALDIGGYATIYGNGSYRQIVKDRLGNQVWDRVVDGYSTTPGNRVAFSTYASMAAASTFPANTTAEVPTTDAGTHTDPVVGGTVNNSGVFRYSTSPAGWQRMFDFPSVGAQGPAGPAGPAGTAGAAGTPGANSGTGATAVSRAAMAAIVSPSSLAPLFLTEAGREGLFAFSTANLSAYVTADPSQGVYVAPTGDTSGASGAWVRKSNGQYDIRWFGGVADCTAFGVGTDNAPAINAAKTLSKVTGLRQIYVPTGKWRISSRVAATEGVQIFGDGWHENPGIAGGVSYPSINSIDGTLFVVDQNVGFLIGYSFTDNANASNALSSLNSLGTGSPEYKYKSASGTVLRDFMVWSQGGTDATKHGIEFRTIVIASNVRVQGFPGNGWHIDADTGGNGATTPYGVADGGSFYRCHAVQNLCHGFFIRGNDANTLTFLGCSARTNGGVGYLDISQLGNSYFLPHTASNNQSVGNGGATISSITFSGTTATLTTSTAHGRTTGDKINVSSAVPAAYNVDGAAVTVTSTTTFTYTMGSTPASNATTVGVWFYGASAQRASIIADAPWLKDAYAGSYATTSAVWAGVLVGAYTEGGIGQKYYFSAPTVVVGGSLTSPGLAAAGSALAINIGGGIIATNEIDVATPGNPLTIGAPQLTVTQPTGNIIAQLKPVGGNGSNLQFWNTNSLGMDIFVTGGAGYFSSGSFQFRNGAQTVNFFYADNTGLNVQTGALKVAGTQVVSTRQTGTAANATDLATALTLVNDLKTKLIAHGLIS